ncbi:MAG: hypothetical protein ABIS86_16540 [Streptosporangiaceae bacterium]
MRKISLSIASLALAAGGLTGCSSSTKWCEFDATDQVVNDSFCKASTPGYEWEHGSKSKKKKHSVKKKTTTK